MSSIPNGGEPIGSGEKILAQVSASCPIACTRSFSSSATSNIHRLNTRHLHLTNRFSGHAQQARIRRHSRLERSILCPVTHAYPLLFHVQHIGQPPRSHHDRLYQVLPLHCATSVRASLPFASCRHIEGHAEKFGRRFVLELVSVHGGMWALQCKDAKEMAMWKDQITQAYAAIQARSAVQPSIAPGQVPAPAAAPARASSVAGASFHER